jgi:staphylococcal nuclease domain-containing protein 1
MEGYAWESKESLRKIVIGKKVKVVVEYVKSVPSKAGSNSDYQMNFASCFLLKNDKNVAAMQLERGLVKTNLSKDQMSKFLEDLLSAEKRAIDAKLCLHSKKEAPKVIFNDLVANPKQAKEYE